jgi:hypothetical protein
MRCSARGKLRSSRSAAFAVTAIAQWWQTKGQAHFPEGKELLILAYGGGGNDCCNRLWKQQLQQRLVARIVITLGFLLSAIALAAAATTQVDTGYGFAATWIAVLGLGAGLALPTASAMSSMVVLS